MVTYGQSRLLLWDAPDAEAPAVGEELVIGGRAWRVTARELVESCVRDLWRVLLVLI